MKQCFNALGGATPVAIYGVLSLITWALMVVVTLKYVCVIMRADNRGEGGILALTALALRSAAAGTRMHWWILAAGLLGAALFYGDGVHHPGDLGALRDRGAQRRRRPLFEPYVIPLTLAILLGLFLRAIARHSAGRRLLGPVMIVWFLIIGFAGRRPRSGRSRTSSLALNPYYECPAVGARAGRGAALLGAVVLAVTGVEALYADMGLISANARSELRLARAFAEIWPISA